MRKLKLEKIPFNIPPYTGSELSYIKEAIDSHHICGDNTFTKRCREWFEKDTGCPCVLLTTSGTHALEMAAQLCDLKPGDEVILPSFTFSSTANAFALQGAKLVFVDIDPRTMNIDPNAAELAISEKTKVICLVHYAGVACDMDRFCNMADKYNLILVEDAAQAVVADYKGKRLGTFGRFGCYSFHETKNFSMGEGGAILLNNPDDIEHAEILREKGTDRSRFFLGLVDKYTWRDKGSSYLPSDINAAYLWAQLEKADLITNARLNSWRSYYELLTPLAEQGLIELPFVPNDCSHNAHMFFIKVKNLQQRTDMISFLREKNIYAVFHYVPLHSAEAGQKYGRFNGEDVYTTSESDRLVRLPMYYGLTEDNVQSVCKAVNEFFNQ